MGGTATGVFSVPVKLRSWQNGRLPEDERGEDIECEALVDSGAAELALPAEMIEHLKLEETGKVQVYAPDGARHTYRVFGMVDLTVQNRSCQVRAIELPHGTTPLLGGIALKEMDWHTRPQGKRLVPNPRSPEGPLLPLC